MSQLPVGDTLHPFPGGLVLRHHKQAACELPLERIALSRDFFLPIVDRRGRRADVLVEVGQTVKRGQALTQADSDLDTVIHAPTSGRIEAVVQRPSAWPPGSRVECLHLAADGRDDGLAPVPVDRWLDTDRHQLIDTLRDRGLAGLGGAVFPSAAKLRGDWDAIQTLILNGAECEPWIACDEMLMRSRADAVVRGGIVLARAAGAREVVIAIEDQMGIVGERLTAAMNDCPIDFPRRLVRVATMYPEGGERQLIQALTGKEVPFDGLPQDLGLLCHNVATAAAALDAVEGGRALTERVVTVTGPGVARPRNVIARIGTPIRELLDAAGGLTAEAGRLILGGPMSGTALSSDEIPMTKGTNCLLVLTREEVRRQQPIMPCINCGECVRVCPARLLPQQLFKMIEGERHDAAAELNLFDCIECGCCAQVCPSHIPLVDWYRHGKAARQLEQLDQRRARLAQRRHDARQTRLEQERLEREARREKRRQRLTEGGQAKDEIQAAIERARRRKTRDPGAG
jgi:electron transport complex protein RnfC